jgi:hypothetical protein
MSFSTFETIMLQVTEHQHEALVERGLGSAIDWLRFHWPE